MTKFLSIHELSDLIGLSDSWIKRHAKAGDIPHVRDRNRLWFPQEQAIKAAEAVAERATGPQDDKEASNG